MSEATVLRDPMRRYILADEVGLGKTIEAGIILHDLLMSFRTRSRRLTGFAHPTVALRVI